MEIAAQQIATREWWEKRRQAFELYISPDVLAEARRGDADAARRRLEALAACKVLAVTPAARQLTKRILEKGLIPPRAAADAAHIGLAAAHGMNFLLTWNCRHIHNSIIEDGLREICEALGLKLPVLCTPPELMADYPAMKNENPIEEIWRIRDEIAAEHGYDVDLLFDAMEREQQTYADRLVYHVPRPTPKEEDAAILREEPPSNP